MQFNILTIFPELFDSWQSASILHRAHEEELIKIGVHNIRDFTEDKHRTVDDTPYGGGAGMVLKIEPIAKAIDSINVQFPISNFQTKPNASMSKTPQRRIAVLSARGKQFTQAKAEEYAQLDELILICGRYEGIDQRVADYLADEEISIGPYVLNGGEVAAMVVIEAVARLLPGVLGNEESLREESYSEEIRNPKSLNPKQIQNSKSLNSKLITNSKDQNNKIASDFTVEYPQYTKPAEYNGWKVPEVLLSGNHEEIRKWRDSYRNR
jgi:tRNA (guanine37-N1)-methyltransferase